MTPQLWRLAFPEPGICEALARRLEAQGWDGVCLADSQNLTGDVYVGLAQMAAVTERLTLATGVTNPVTRHPAATASAIATVHEASAGRAVLGIGRGDSALFHIGREPAPLREFGPYLRRVAGYLRGETVDLDGHESELRWLARSTLDPVPVDVAATGPKVIGLAATVADGITFAVGADPERLGWGIDVAERAREQAGLSRAGLSYACFVNIAPHPDRETAVDLVRGGIGAFAHFSGMAGSSADGQAAADREVFTRLHETYERDQHTMNASTHARGLDPDFVTRFGIVGPVDGCIEKLRAVVATGVDRVVLIGPSLDADADARRLSERLLRDEVAPAVRAG